MSAAKTIEAAAAASESLTPAERLARRAKTTTKAAEDAKPKVKKERPKPARGQKRSLADLAAAGKNRRGDVDFEWEPEPEIEVGSGDPVHDIAQALADAVASAQLVKDSVLGMGLSGAEIDELLQTRFGLPPELLAACVAWAIASDL